MSRSAVFVDYGRLTSKPEIEATKGRAGQKSASEKFPPFDEDSSGRRANRSDEFGHLASDRQRETGLLRGLLEKNKRKRRYSALPLSHWFP